MRELNHHEQQRVAPNIYRTRYGWRVYVRRGGTLKPVRFPPETKLEELKLFVDQFKLDSKRIRLKAKPAPAPGPTGFTADAKAYLALESVKAMPSLDRRTFEINRWATIFGERPRELITPRDINEELQRLLNEGYAASSVNKFRTALMSLWTSLDGRSARNPVKDTTVFEEAPVTARGQSYELLTVILDSIDPTRTRPTRRRKGSRTGANASRVRLELLAWTGMDPSQIMRMNPATDVSVAGRWYITPPRRKGSRRSRTPRPVIQKPMVAEAVPVFERAIELGIIGKTFDVHSLRRVWTRAIARTEKALRKELKNPKFRIPHIRLKDLRHSFGTRVFETTQSRETAGLMLDHAPGSPLTLRYTLGAVPNVLREQMKKFGGSRRKPKRKAG